MKTLMITLVAATALSTVAPAFAQTAYRQVPNPAAEAQYQRDMDAYNAQQQQYQNQRGAYDARVDAYANDRVAYENRRAQYLRDRDAYDRRYGTGAYDRAYPDYYRDFYSPYEVRYAAPQNQGYSADRVAFENRRAQYLRDRAAYDRRYGAGSYDRRYPQYYRDYSVTYDQRYGNGADRYGVDTNAQVAVCNNRSNATAGGLIGALAGAAIGSNVAARNARTEGAVLGAVVGGAIGANIAKSTYNCDQTGAYYSYNQTVPYREALDDRRTNSGRYNYSYYAQQRCRLAAAPAEYGGRAETRYVRVCPDAQGRYRITG